MCLVARLLSPKSPSLFLSFSLYFIFKLLSLFYLVSRLSSLFLCVLGHDPTPMKEKGEGRAGQEGQEEKEVKRQTRNAFVSRATPSPLIIPLSQRLHRTSGAFANGV